MPEEISGVIKGDFKIQGHIDNLKVFGQSSGQQLDFWGEGIPQINLNFLYEKEVLDISKIIIKKRNGSASGNYSFDIKKKKHQYDFLLEGIRIHEFEKIDSHFFGIDGEVSMSGKGQVADNNFDCDINFLLKDSSIMGEVVPNSSGFINVKNKIVNMEWAIFDNDINIKTKFFLNTPKKPSVIKADFNSSRIRELLSIFFPHNIERFDISGLVKARAKIEFMLNNIKNLNANINIQELNYISEKIKFSNNPKKSKNYY